MTVPKCNFSDTKNDKYFFRKLPSINNLKTKILRLPIIPSSKKTKQPNLGQTVTFDLQPHML